MTGTTTFAAAGSFKSATAPWTRSSVTFLHRERREFSARGSRLRSGWPYGIFQFWQKCCNSRLFLLQHDNFRADLRPLR
ncbi:hypothetical protein HF325_003274 [Metschnikowia pulcherrima]|uniref:Uncharacterized protein n=1 Tax=Metschnikowia pulcherrima TaxID=27326 RepID=A0A8H7LBI3_9ASCO|nr:hypothetical protein HF325_003274 [Metschnikowia pulcherrima]